MAQCSKTLVLLLGPTGVGKTELSLRLAKEWGSPIISCDSRQVFREIPIGTAAPTADEQARVQHYFIGSRSIFDDYSAGQYERDALALLNALFATHNTLLMTGGSMLYADAVCYGLDDLPTVPPDIRRMVAEQGKDLSWLQAEVQRLDPGYWQVVDRQNPARLRHCVELCLTTGRPYSSLLTKPSAISRQLSDRPFRIIKVALNRPREELYARIDRRVEEMMAGGLLEEAKRVFPHRHLTSLQTVGFRELFAYLEGQYDLQEAIRLIQQNTRHYAKRQITWFRRDKDIHWLDARNDYEENLHSIDDLLHADSLQA